MEWTVEIVKGLGRMLLHPVFYFSMIWVLLAGFWRIKRERHDFHVRVHTIYLELRHLFPAGILVGIVLSIVSIMLGLTIPLKLLVILAVVTIVLTVIGNARLLSAAFTVGIPLLLLSSFSLFSFEWDFLDQMDSNYLLQMDSNYLLGATVMLGLLLGCGRVSDDKQWGTGCLT
ncbi:hypothetical protein ACA29_06505 [Lederbergia galactosidilytica]|uniref:Uncharacterized protein n=1 Tax=Lederbergia galactosidilytica TaxID=217031 RepID=A0A0Q9XZN7_9BACI|nr:hypothetical protein ACA29_06505 [Lederbergia galactosidilytica]